MCVNLLLTESPEPLPILKRRHGHQPEDDLIVHPGATSGRLAGARGSGIMSVRSVQPNGTLLFEIALTMLGIVGIGLPLAFVIILVCR
jgi:hypothetical protein